MKPPGVDVSAGLVIHLGDEAETFAKAWTKVEETLGQPSKPAEADGSQASWHVMPAPEAVGVDGDGPSRTNISCWRSAPTRDRRSSRG